METIKAGCILVDVERKKIALVYRDNKDDYTFPKGHLEKGESIEECAIRETAEETKRNCIILKSEEPYIQEYVTPDGEKCICYMFIAIDRGHSSNNSTDTHDVHWLSFDKVEEKLSYSNLKNMWNELKDKIEKLFI